MQSVAPDIRLLTFDDLDAAFGLSSTAGWNQRIADWRMLLQLAPAGSFAALRAGQLVGTAIGIDYGAFGWIAMMLVDPAFRGQGIGARLLEAAIGAVPEQTPIRLDATPLGRPLYQRYGFVDEATLTRHVAVAGPRTGQADRRPAAGDVRRMTASDLPALDTIDRGVFGGNRRVVLEWSLESGPDYAHVIESAGGTHYCLGRRGRLFDQIGPIVAAAAADAQALVAASMPAAGDRAVAVDAFDARQEFAAWLGERGFTPQRPLFRMRRPARVPAPAQPARQSRADGAIEFAILGPEFG